MIEEFIPYEDALELKGMGFDEPCLASFYTLDGVNWKFATMQHYNELDEMYDIGKNYTISAPTFSQVFKWFRKNYNQHCFIHYHSKPEYTFAVYNDIDMYWTLHKKISFNTYEKAELQCLKKLIQIVKNIKE